MESRHVDVLAEISRVLNLEAQSILRCAERLNSQDSGLQIKKALEIFHATLDRGGKIVVTGVGKSGKIARKIAATLSSTGSFAVFMHPTEGLHGDLGIVSGKDAVLALSYTGNTDELVRLVPSLKNLGVPLIGLGGKPQSVLAQKCEVWIDGYVEQEACPHNLAPTTSTTLALALGDAIAVTLMQLRGFDAQSFARNHPGGTLGRRLHWSVADLMHSGEAMAVATAESSMEEVIVASTRKKLGAVVVLDRSRLLGIVTDGDLRRALQHRERFFTLKASEVMTRDPVTARADMKAEEALRLMEDRPSQINVVPVVDQDGNCIGIVRLHDLVQNL